MALSITPEDLIGWAKAFAFTELVEMPIYRFVGPTKWTYAFLASAITHPFVWFVFPLLGEELAIGYVATSIASEVFAIAVEAIFVRRVSGVGAARALVVSLAANLSSVGLGLLVRETTGLI